MFALQRIKIDYLENLPPFAVGWVKGGEESQVFVVARDAGNNPTILFLSGETMGFCDPTRLVALASYITEDFAFEVDPATMEDFNSTDDRFGGLVVLGQELRILVKFEGRFGHASFRVGQCDPAGADRAVIYKSWQIVDTSTDKRPVIYRHG